MLEVSIKVNRKEIGYMQIRNVGTDWSKNPPETTYIVDVGEGVCATTQRATITHIRRDGAVALVKKALAIAKETK